jgi:signal transduction histidine kinase/CheY-like chemotaxis protein
MVDSGISATNAVAASCSLLHTLIEELAAGGAGDEGDRRVRAARAIEAVPLPAAVFAGALATEPLTNAAWRATLGVIPALPPRLVEAMRSARGDRALHYLAQLEVALPDRVAFFAVTLQALRAGGGTVLVCSEITDQVIAKKLGCAGPALIWRVPGAGGPAYYNAAWHSVIDRDWMEALHEADAPSWASAAREAERTRQPIAVELRLRVLPGAYRWHRVRLVWDHGDVLCSAVDVHGDRGHEQERNELVAQARKARADADRATRIKDVFLATVSHELRAPLTTMLLWEKVLRENPGDDAAREQALDAIHQCALAQARLVTDLLDFARGNTGKLFLDIRLVHVDKLATDALDAARPAAVAKHVELVNASAPFVGSVHADETRLRQILDNLLSNAIKFTEPGGKVALAVGRKDQSVTIEVLDTGRGIPQEFLTKIFEPFSQAEDALTRREGGLGLGLTISRQLIELHRGSLIAASEGPGKGAKFTVTLPVAGTPRAPSPPLGTRGLRRLDNVHVLVVDDDAGVRKALAVLLGRVGIRVDTADSAAAARTRIAETPPQAMICDIAMPGEDGYTFLRSLRDSGCEIPAIALTAFATEMDEQRAFDAGFDIHLTKPISIERLVEALSDVLGEPTP